MRRKLIEVSIPLEAINAASAREKSIRHGHPSTLHLWWARRPLAACRAVLFAQLVDDPSAWPERFPTEEAQEVERRRLHKVIERLVPWEASNDEAILNEARWEIARSVAWGLGEEPPPRGDGQAILAYLQAKAPPVYDPFCGGGSIPLEAQRLGLRAYGSDLNPVAVLISKALVEIPPKFAGLPPVGARASRSHDAHHDAAATAALPGARASRSPDAPHDAAATAALPHKAWHSRGYLPHFDSGATIQTLTFRLADSLPRAAYEQVVATAADDAERRERIDAMIDEGRGACLLRDPALAAIVRDALRHFDGERYRLLAWVVMPNHVHALIEQIEGFRLGDILHSWKSFTAKEINKRRASEGAVWAPDYFDRYIRNERHLQAALRYIEDNPVKAGLVASAQDWAFSSAREGSGGTPALLARWNGRGAQGLAEDVRHYGQWMRDEAQKRIGHLYPGARASRSHVAAGTAARQDARQEALHTVIAWLWARTVRSPDPAAKGAMVPLVSSFMLSTKEGRKAWVEPVLDAAAPDGWRFEVRTGSLGKAEEEQKKLGTKSGKGQAFVCVLTGAAIDRGYVQAEGKSDRLGQRLMAIVAEGDRSRIYLSPDPDHEMIARSAAESPIVAESREGFLSAPTPTRAMITGGVCSAYGLRTYWHLFTPRQLVALTTFSDLVGEAREKVLADARAAGLPSAPPLAEGGTGAEAYADAVATYLALSVTKLTDNASTVCSWHSGAEHQKIRATFSRQALPMTWDYAEGNAFSDSTGNFYKQVGILAEALGRTEPVASGGIVSINASRNSFPVRPVIISTDPPYYDNIGYADLSDFFYIWLRRSLAGIWPGLFRRLTTPKAEELVATPYRHGGKEQAEAFFMTGMSGALSAMRQAATDGEPLTVYYAYKQSEIAQEGVFSPGWTSFLQAVVDTGLVIDGTWPVRTELSNRMIAKDANALASSIVLVCRKRAANAPVTDRAGLISLLRRELPGAIADIRKAGVGPVDMQQAVIGPGMGVFSRHARVLEDDDSAMSVKTALALINRVWDEIDQELAGSFDNETQVALSWFSAYGFEAKSSGELISLANAKNIGTDALFASGVFKDLRGKAALTPRPELPGDWTPSRDRRPTVWECVQHTARVLAAEDGGGPAAARLVADMGSKAADARALAYRLFEIATQKGWAAEALVYNELAQEWPKLEDIAAAAAPPAQPVQTELFAG